MNYNFDEIINRRGSDSVKWDQYGEDVLPMWVADMDFKASPAIIKALQKRLDHGVFGYEKVPQAYFDAISSWFSRRHGWTWITRDNVIPTTGVIAAYGACIKAFTRPGDRVIVMSPCYNAFFPVVRNNGCLVAESPLIYEDGKYSIDFDSLEELASDPRTPVLLLCNPQNPVGRVWTRAELLRVGEICVRNNVFVIADEIHCEITAPGVEYVPYGTLPSEMVLRSATCCSPTKPFNIAGIQIANVIALDPDVVRRIDRAINDNECCDVNVFGVTALMAAYNESEGWLDAFREYIWENERTVRAFLAEHLPMVTAPPLEGTYLMWLDFSALAVPQHHCCHHHDEEEHHCHHDEKEEGHCCHHRFPVPLGFSRAFGEYLRKNGLALCDGPLYGEYTGEGFMRLNLACPRATLLDGLHRLSTAITRLG
ncbi:MAG: pyridoxal phosphate-dependent aminotransferase [Bacteroidales bacterium]|nr:pyridoxal phosphate-dependent aminotransferase [Bacteroidales bacterium]